MATQSSRRKAAESLPAAFSVFDLPVLPAADVFPMMPPDDLAELADDIREHGLREPLVTAILDGDLVLVDGRNRRAACKEAGVEPDVRQLNGEDPVAYVMSANIHRRHMTKGQRAMAVAMVYPEAASYRRGGTNLTEIVGLGSPQYLSYARTVLKFTPQSAPGVLSGAMSLDAAYQEAKVVRERAELEATKLEEAAVEAPKPATVTQLADMGRRPASKPANQAEAPKPGAPARRAARRRRAAPGPCDQPWAGHRCLASVPAALATGRRSARCHRRRSLLRD